MGAAGLVAAGGTAGLGTITLTACGALGLQNLPAGLVVVGTQALQGAGASATVAQTTPGVAATARGALTGGELLDLVNGVAYINTGTPAVPVWTKIGTQA